MVWEAEGLHAITSKGESSQQVLDHWGRKNMAVGSPQPDIHPSYGDGGINWAILLITEHVSGYLNLNLLNKMKSK